MDDSQPAGAMEPPVGCTVVDNDRSKASTGLKIATIAVLIVLTALNCIYFFAPGHPAVVIPRAIGNLISPFVTFGIVVLIFQIFKRFRNPRSRWKIVLLTTSILLTAKIFHIARTVSTFLSQLAG